MFSVGLPRGVPTGLGIHPLWVVPFRFTSSAYNLGTTVCGLNQLHVRYTLQQLDVPFQVLTDCRG